MEYCLFSLYAGITVSIHALPEEFIPFHYPLHTHANCLLCSQLLLRCHLLSAPHRFPLKKGNDVVCHASFLQRRRIYGCQPLQNCPLFPLISNMIFKPLSHYFELNEHVQPHCGASSTLQVGFCSQFITTVKVPDQICDCYSGR